MWKDELKNLSHQGLYRERKAIRPLSSVEGLYHGRKLLLFCTNDYLGLAHDSRVMVAAQQALKKYGSGSGAAPLISGYEPLTEELEEKLSRWNHTSATLVVNSGTHANLGAIPALVGEGDVIFSDALNHASLIDGSRLSKAKIHIFKHNDLEHLKDLLKKNPPKKQGKRLIVTEAVFSMEGDQSPIQDILTMADRFNALVYYDEAHAVGIYGKNGSGIVSSTPENLIRMGTLGKTFGSYGAFISGSKELKKYLVNKSRTYIFSTALPPSSVGAALESLKIIQKEKKLRKQLWKNVQKMSVLLQELGLPVLKDSSPIFSIQIGDNKKVQEISKKLLGNGIYIQGIRPPTVPEGTARLRLTVSAAHREKDLKKLRSEFIHHQNHPARRC